MKKAKKLRKSRPFLVALLFAGIAAAALSSCSQTQDVTPITPVPNKVTVRVQSNSLRPATQHLRIITSLTPSGVVLDTNITGSFVYTFPASTNILTVTATLSSDVPFSSGLSIDANNRLEAYHNSNCVGNEIDITREIDFSR